MWIDHIAKLFYFDFYIAEYLFKYWSRWFKKCHSYSTASNYWLSSFLGCTYNIKVLLSLEKFSARRDNMNSLLKVNVIFLSPRKVILTKVKPRSRPRNRLMVQSSLTHHQVRSIIWLSKSQRSLSVVSIHKGNKCFSSLVSCDLFMFMPSLILAIAYYTARPLQNSNCHNSEIISWIGSKLVGASFEKGFG